MANMFAMNEKRVNYLLPYMDKLVNLHGQGATVYKELREVTDALRFEFGMLETNSNAIYVNLTHHIEHHPLIAWDPVRKEPVIKDSAEDNGNTGRADISVWDTLRDLALGKTVHQLCLEYNLDINQVSGAVIFAAYAIRNGQY